MPPNKTESGISNVECFAFPTFSAKKELLKDKSCHIIEPYDDGKLLSIFILKDRDGNAVKVLDKDGVHLHPENMPIGKDVMTALNVGIHLRLPQSQLFFSIKDDKMTLVDVFDGKNFVSPGMIQDVYGKRLKIQQTRSIERYNPNKIYGAIIKPVIMCYDDNKPVYIKD